MTKVLRYSVTQSIGQNPISHKSATKLLDVFLADFHAGHHILIDFSGVKHLAPPFFHKLILVASEGTKEGFENFQQRVEFANLPPLGQRIVSAMLSRYAEDLNNKTLQMLNTPPRRLGDVIKEDYLQKHGLCSTVLSYLIHEDKTKIEECLNSKVPFCPVLLCKLAVLFSVEPQMFLDIQSKWQAWTISEHEVLLAGDVTPLSSK
ncbi:STAS-like domain-containing protein [Vibrio sp. D431a]|uniref:STAS-like domain-containing protein n=1 Tax=Vibrio sp. D431a TaxID=2837388 RepID=UPI0025537B1A|nr:DUF4325 domain-containing protein [Vibrio sp. D431a]MDK9789858.1 DUF4325 domain-containing protein [Vibrio sp. D431a]